MSPGFDIVQVIPYPETAVDLSTEVSLAKAAKPDVIAPLTRPATAIILLEELARQRADIMGVISPGAPGLYEGRQIEQLKQRIEHVMDCVPWPDYKHAGVQRVGAEYTRRTGKLMDTSASFTYEAVQVIADALERARSADPDAVVEAIRQTNFTGGINIATGRRAALRLPPAPALRRAARGPPPAEPRFPIRATGFSSRPREARNPAPFGALRHGAVFATSSVPAERLRHRRGAPHTFGEGL
jgi:hypothetical protein